MHRTSREASTGLLEEYFGANNPYTYAIPTKAKAKARAKMCLPTLLVAEDT